MRSSAHHLEGDVVPALGHVSDPLQHAAAHPIAGEHGLRDIGKAGVEHERVRRLVHGDDVPVLHVEHADLAEHQQREHHDDTATHDTTSGASWCRRPTTLVCPSIRNPTCQVR